MKFKRLCIEDVILLTPKLFEDSRGFFFESFNKKKFESILSYPVDFLQDNHSFSLKNTLRGIHYQKKPCEQGKLVRVLEGEVFDVAVDLRKNSPTYGEWVGEYLSDTNNNQLWIPEGFGHGFYVVSESAHFLYKTTSYYNPESESSILWNDKDINIKWPLAGEPSLSDKDKLANSFKEFNDYI
jgi:dTDP-4-dehydrorhamnose 3,5-epimerase